MNEESTPLYDPQYEYAKRLAANACREANDRQGPAESGYKPGLPSYRKYPNSVRALAVSCSADGRGSIEYEDGSTDYGEAGTILARYNENLKADIPSVEQLYDEIAHLKGLLDGAQRELRDLKTGIRTILGDRETARREKAEREAREKYIHERRALPPKKW